MVQNRTFFVVVVVVVVVSRDCLYRYFSLFVIDGPSAFVNTCWHFPVQRIVRLTGCKILSFIHQFVGGTTVQVKIPHTDEPAAARSWVCTTLQDPFARPPLLVGLHTTIISAPFVCRVGVPSHPKSPARFCQKGLRTCRLKTHFGQRVQDIKTDLKRRGLLIEMARRFDYRKSKRSDDSHPSA